MPKNSKMDKSIPQEPFQHRIPTQLKSMLGIMSDMEKEPVKDTINRILIDGVFNYFSGLNIVHVLKLKYKENFNMPWHDRGDFFPDKEKVVEVGNEEEEDLLKEESA